MRADDCDETAFPSSWHTIPQPQDSYWVDHPMVELDIDPGRWRVKGLLVFSEQYQGSPTDFAQGFHALFLSLYQRPIGSTAKTLAIVNRKTPLSKPVGLFTFPDLRFYATITVSAIVNSTAGLTLSLEGRFEGSGSSHAVEHGNDVWLGPGALIATPL